MKEVFNELDKDGSGALDYAELTLLAKRFFDGRSPTEKHVRSIFSQLDLDQDGRITQEEMVQGAQRMAFTFQNAIDDFNHADEAFAE
eukprot:807444-Prymnesium_polylepis.2